MRVYERVSGQNLRGFIISLFLAMMQRIVVYPVWIVFSIFKIKNVKLKAIENVGCR